MCYCYSSLDYINLIGRAPSLLILEAYLTAEPVSGEPLPADTVVGPVGIFALCERIAVVDVQHTLIVVRTPVLKRVFH